MLCKVSVVPWAKCLQPTEIQTIQCAWHTVRCQQCVFQLWFKCALGHRMAIFKREVT